ncbi:hypothetical protein FEM48_Zijuj02G0113200 [Ziziphus jujuba var. spinosa]|uniref:Peroxidase n=1 Tax=Ziziphus jujuba var. spinosa TaxID=714518 RepID=A0A978VVF4_ZIZJJ|nr:hypothetical protein FEM48_Zijuj02G0113200 [Ziziphus jujuba var. spinosa]
MALNRNTNRSFCLFVITMFMFGIRMGQSQLSSYYYSNTCPRALSTIRNAVMNAVAKEHRMGGSLLRLHFHDCFVNANIAKALLWIICFCVCSLCGLICMQGCDGSVLLDDTSSFTGEKTAAPNKNSLRGFEVIDDIKSQVESICPGVVSCADILAVVARSHTTGKARCLMFRPRIHNETNIDSAFATSLKSSCTTSTTDDDNLASLDATTPVLFDNGYFKNLVNNKGLLHSDQQLFSGGSTDSQVTNYVNNPSTFFQDFANAMVKMGNMSPLTGSSGEIRGNCRKIN